MLDQFFSVLLLLFCFFALVLVSLSPLTSRLHRSVVWNTNCLGKLCFSLILLFENINDWFQDSDVRGLSLCRFGFVYAWETSLDQTNFQKFYVYSVWNGFLGYIRKKDIFSALGFVLGISLCPWMQRVLSSGQLYEYILNRRTYIS